MQSHDEQIRFLEAGLRLISYVVHAAAPAWLGALVMKSAARCGMS